MARLSKKRSLTTTYHHHHAPCPVCGKLFTLRRIEQHADRCATQKFLDIPRGENDSPRLPDEPRPSSRAKRSTKRLKRSQAPAAIPRDTVHIANGGTPHPPCSDPSISRLDSQSDVSPPATIRLPAAVPTARDLLRQSPTPALVMQHVKCWSFPDSEVVQFRGSPLIHAKALPARLLDHVRRLEHKLMALPVEAVSLTTAKGTIDKRKTLELQRRIQEEEYQLALYRSTKTAGKYGATTRRSRRLMDFDHAASLPFFDSSTALIEAAEAHVTDGPPLTDTVPTKALSCHPPHLLMRVLVTTTGFFCEHLRNGARFCVREFPWATAMAETMAGDSQCVSKDAGCIDQRFGQSPCQPIPEEAMKQQMPAPYSTENRHVSRRRSSRARTPSVKHSDAVLNMPSSNRSFNAARFECPGAEDPNGTEPHPECQTVMSRKKRRRVYSQQSTTNQDALEYVRRMRNFHNIDSDTIATFVNLLKAYKTKALSVDEVARKITTLLSDYPDLIKDFAKFLPLPGDIRLSAHAKMDRKKRNGLGDDLPLPVVDVSGSQSNEEADPNASFCDSAHPSMLYDAATTHEQAYPGYAGFHRIGGPEWLSLCPIPPRDRNGHLAGTARSSSMQDEHTNPKEKDDPNPHDEHCVSLQPGIYWRPFDYEDSNAVAEQGGFSDVGTHAGGGYTAASSSDFVHADVWGYTSEDAKKGAVNRLSSGHGVEDSDADPADACATVDNLERLLLKYVENMEPQAPNNRHVFMPNRNGSPSVPRTKVKIFVDEALKECAATTNGISPVFMNDYERMKDIAYEVWDRFKHDMYSFDAFAGIVLEANRTQASCHLSALTSMLERLKCLFNSDAEDVIEKLIDAQPEHYRQYMHKIRDSWPKSVESS